MELEFHHFADMPWYLKTVVVFAVFYFPVMAICYFRFRRVHPEDASNFFKVWRQIGILRKAINSTDQLLRIFGRIYAVMQAFAGVLAVYCVYYGGYELQTPVELFANLSREQGVPRDLHELAARFDAVKVDDTATATFQLAVEESMKLDNRQLYREFTQFPRPLILRRVPVQMKNQLETAVLQGAEPLALLDDLCKTNPKVKNRLDLAMGVDANMEYLAGIRNAAELIVLRTIHELESKAPDPAVNQSVDEILVLGRSLQYEPVMISAIVHYATVVAAAYDAELLLNYRVLDDEQRSKLIKLLQTTETELGLLLAIDGEEVIGRSKFDLSSEALSKLAASSHNKDWESISWADVTHRSIRARNSDKLYFFEAMQHLRKQGQLNCPASLNMFEPIDSVRRKAYDEGDYISLLAIPPYEEAFHRQAVAIAYLRCAAVATAIQKFEADHRAFVNELSELVPQYLPTIPADPMTGFPVKHKLSGRLHLVYSVGTNRHDDSLTRTTQTPELNSDDIGIYMYAR